MSRIRYVTFFPEGSYGTTFFIFFNSDFTALYYALQSATTLVFVQAKPLLNMGIQGIINIPTFQKYTHKYIQYIEREKDKKEKNIPSVRPSVRPSPTPSQIKISSLSHQHHYHHSSCKWKTGGERFSTSFFFFLLSLFFPIPYAKPMHGYTKYTNITLLFIKKDFFSFIYNKYHDYIDPDINKSRYYYYLFLNNIINI